MTESTSFLTYLSRSTASSSIMHSLSLWYLTLETEKHSTSVLYLAQLVIPWTVLPRTFTCQSLRLESGCTLRQWVLILLLPPALLTASSRTKRPSTLTRLSKTLLYETAVHTLNTNGITSHIFYIFSSQLSQFNDLC